MESEIRPGPLDPSILWLQAFHRSEDVWNNDDTSVLSFREHETHTFYLVVGEATIMLQDVAILLGLRVHGRPVIDQPVDDWHAVLEELLGRYARAYNLALMGSMLFADKSGDAVSLFICHYLGVGMLLRYTTGVVRLLHSFIVSSVELVSRVLRRWAGLVSFCSCGARSIFVSVHRPPYPPHHDADQHDVDYPLGSQHERVETDDTLHKMDRRSWHNWVSVHSTQLQGWSRRESLVIQGTPWVSPSSIQDEYMTWYHGITRLIITRRTEQRSPTHYQPATSDFLLSLAVVDIHHRLTRAMEAISKLPDDKAFPLAVETIRGVTSFCSEMLSRHRPMSSYARQPRPPQPRTAQFSSTVHRRPLQFTPTRPHVTRPRTPQVTPQPTPQVHPTPQFSPPLIQSTYGSHEDGPRTISEEDLGANAMWQWDYFISPLIPKFNVYVPDLIFFGESYTTRSERTESFQAESMKKMMDKLEVQKISVCGVSYGGFVAYSMAAQFPDAVEKVVLVCSGVCLEEKDVEEGMFKVANVEDAADILLPQTPEKLKELMKLSFYKPRTSIPSCFLTDFIQVSDNSLINYFVELFYTVYISLKVII
ncbi:hypothetical protein RDABS01_004795 [Bienertia sinuspersici]